MDPNLPSGNFNPNVADVTGNSVNTSDPNVQTHATQDVDYSPQSTSSKFFAPTGGELSFPIFETPTDKVETLTQAPERTPSPEVLRPETSPKPLASTPANQNQYSPVQVTAPAPAQNINIVSKTNEITKLHHLGTSDQLTSIADLEEEQFIQQVEAAHGHK